MRAIVGELRIATAALGLAGVGNERADIHSVDTQLLIQMNAMDLQVAKWGNSLALRIPAEIVRRFGLRSGDTLNAQITLDGAITIRAAAWSRSAFAAELEQARQAIPQGTSVVEAMRSAERY